MLKTENENIYEPQAYKELVCSEEMSKYFFEIEKSILRARAHSELARKKGYDPEDFVDIPLAKNMIQRVEWLIGTVAPQLIGSNLAKRISELEQVYGALAWEVACKIAEETAKGNFCKFRDREEAIEVAIRVGFAYHTLGIVSAPLEGFTNAKIKKRKDGKEYLSVWFAGPIRGAGGTAASVCVLIADFVRTAMGLSPYDPSESEINRVVTEITDYQQFVTNLQYFPSEEEIKFMIKHIPVEINGEPTEKRDVSNYKDLPRIETNKIRGGVCLVVAEGLCQKAAKIYGKIGKWKDMPIDWSFLSEFLEIQKRIKAKKQEMGTEKNEKILPNFTYITDIVAGRPVLSHPMAKGGFRLRYGRSRNSGYVAVGINPATMHLLKGYLAIGTQLKIERPGKGSTVTTNCNIQGPLVRLKDGSVLRIKTEDQAIKLKDKIERIIFLGDILINYGDFVTFNHTLVPAGYCEEWWIQELEKASVNMFGSIDLYKISDLSGVKQDIIQKILSSPISFIPSSQDAINLSKALSIPLHPEYTYHWNDISKEEFILLLTALQNSEFLIGELGLEKIIINDNKVKEIIENLGISHMYFDKKIIIEKNEAVPLVKSLGIENPSDIEEKINIAKNIEESRPLFLVNIFSELKIRDKSGTYIGARMGRPEKSKMRKLKGSPHVLFPVGDEGGKFRSFQSAMDVGKITADFALFFCEKCNNETIFSVCEKCGVKTIKRYYCRACNNVQTVPTCKKHGKNQRYINKSININDYFEKVIRKLNIKSYPDLIKGVRGTFNKDHIPEHLVKGILRAKYDIYVNKDGTTRHDISELPLTHFRPREIKTPIEKLKEMGYLYDINGMELSNPDQILEIKPQDVILPTNPLSKEDAADDVLFRVANFIDDLLVNFYGCEPYYNLKTKDDLIGHLIIGLAPHISSGIVGRIIGFSEVQGFLCHPLFHSAMRRDCDGDETSAILLMDAFLNFSRQYLPDKRGGRTMDAPLVLTMFIIPSEVDDQSHDLDIVWKYPLSFYEAAMQYKSPKEVKINQLKHHIKTPNQYEGMGFTIDTDNFNNGITVSAYKTLPSMEEKLKGQMELASIIRAVDEVDVATLVIDKHFIKDIKGNLRKFSTQNLRCVNCNEKYRRPPLKGVCLKCGGKIIFTVSIGSIIKYLEPSFSIAEKFAVSPYLKQTLELTKERIYGVFGREKEKQEGLGRWFG